jgi:tRNA pseudouridine38-40 synthase
MGRIKLTLAYTGTAYAGWQLQPAGIGRSTIQHEVEKALAAVTGEHVRVHGASRTDAGVHAEGQVARFDAPEKSRIRNWQRALNAKLPPDIRVLEAAQASDAFNARRDAVSKQYAYTLFTGNAVPPRLAPFVWAMARQLDSDAMREAASLLVGRHDFASFRNAGTPVRNTVRTLSAIWDEPGRAGSFVCPPSWPVTTWFFEGEGFLKQMVRNLMGLLVRVGEGTIGPPAVSAILEAQSRKALPSPSAPARGLTLMRVIYA